MRKIAIIEYGMGNIDSIARAIEYCGGDPIVTNDRRVIETVGSIILPGVGAFRKGMKKITQLKLDEVLYEQVIHKQIPLLGICLGMQLLASQGYEFEKTKGLGFIEGDVPRLISDNHNETIPHIGWNVANFVKDSPLFDKLESGRDFYFVHSYNFKCNDENNILAYTPYCGNFASVVAKGNIFGTQFHPEKSQKAGFQLIKNFLNF